MDMKGLTGRTVQDKQKRLLSQDAGHFSLVRALHAADYITELNGTFLDIHSDMTPPVTTRKNENLY